MCHASTCPKSFPLCAIPNLSFPFLVCVKPSFSFTPACCLWLAWNLSLGCLYTHMCSSAVLCWAVKSQWWLHFDLFECTHRRIFYFVVLKAPSCDNWQCVITCKKRCQDGGKSGIRNWIKSNQMCKFYTRFLSDAVWKHWRNASHIQFTVYVVWWDTSCICDVLNCARNQS